MKMTEQSTNSSETTYSFADEKDTKELQKLLSRVSVSGPSSGRPRSATDSRTVERHDFDDEWNTTYQRMPQAHLAQNGYNTNNFQQADATPRPPPMFLRDCSHNLFGSVPMQRSISGPSWSGGAPHGLPYPFDDPDVQHRYAAMEWPSPQFQRRTLAHQQPTTTSVNPHDLYTQYAGHFHGNRSNDDLGQDYVHHDFPYPNAGRMFMDSALTFAQEEPQDIFARQHFDMEPEDDVREHIDLTSRESSYMAQDDEDDFPNSKLPYNKLLYRCLMDSPNQELDLQGIYTWFRANTSKTVRLNEKAWQNSIRHNLSMNEGFKKGPRAAQSYARKNMWSLTDEAIRNCAIEPTTRFRKDHCRSRKRRVPNVAHHVTGARITRRSARLNPTALLPRRVRELSAAPSSTGHNTASSSPMLAMRSTSPAVIPRDDVPAPSTAPYYLPLSHPSTPPHLYSHNDIGLPPTYDDYDSAALFHGHIHHNNNNNNNNNNMSHPHSDPRMFSYSPIPFPSPASGIRHTPPLDRSTATASHHLSSPYSQIQGVLPASRPGENLFYSSGSEEEDDFPVTPANGDEGWNGGVDPYFLP